MAGTRFSGDTDCDSISVWDFHSLQVWWLCAILLEQCEQLGGQASVTTR